MEVNDKVFHKELGEGIIVATHKTDKLLGDEWVRVKFDKKPSLMYNAGVNPYVVEVVKLWIVSKDVIIFDDETQKDYEQWKNRNETIFHDSKQKPLLPENWEDVLLYKAEDFHNHALDAFVYGLQNTITKPSDKYWHNSKETFYVENPSTDDYICMIETENTEIAFRFCAGQKYDLSKVYTIDDLKNSKTLNNAFYNNRLKKLTHQEFHDYVAFCINCNTQFKTKEEALAHNCHISEQVKINLKKIPSYIEERQGKTKQDKKEMIKKCIEWWGKNSVKGESK